ncbi:MAG TPA: ATP-binding protein [Bryobacteraceae bacterium]|nr:ATP-binding protein [Bryobacteraceae bacterium]
MSNRTFRVKLPPAPKVLQAGFADLNVKADPTPATGLVRRFANLRVRPKLIILHNLFFLLISCAVYFTVIPPFERRVSIARMNEINLIRQLFAEDRTLPGMASYDFREGSAETMGLTPEVKAWLDAHPGQVYHGTGSDHLYKKLVGSDLYRRITLPNMVYDDVLRRAKISLFAVLGIVYVLAVLTLELAIMPRYVYQPLRLMLDADEATRKGDRAGELIAEELIPGDEIGQIMRSRNDTVKELRKREDDLETALGHLEAQDRLASLGMLSASVAHEMNTPLAVLHGSVEKLMETVKDPHAQERLARMLRVTQRLRRISEGLLDFAKVRKEEVGTVPVKPLVDESWSLLAIESKAAEVKFTNCAKNEAVVGNSDRLVQVFVNLLRNSLNAVESGGEIWVKTRCVMREGKQFIGIAVEDNGPGIPTDVLPEIFDAFVSSQLDSRGTGLGLTVAQGIVQQHGGTIMASNRPGGGARLEVILRSAA